MFFYCISFLLRYVLNLSEKNKKQIRLGNEFKYDVNQVILPLFPQNLLGNVALAQIKNLWGDKRDALIY